MGSDNYVSELLVSGLQSELDSLEEDFTFAETLGITVPMFEESSEDHNS